MAELRVHLTLLDSDPAAHEQTVAFLEWSTVVPDGIDEASYARSLRARVYVTHDTGAGSPAQATVDLLPADVPG